MADRNEQSIARPVPVRYLTATEAFVRRLLYGLSAAIGVLCLGALLGIRLWGWRGGLSFAVQLAVLLGALLFLALMFWDLLEERTGRDLDRSGQVGRAPTVIRERPSQDNFNWPRFCAFIKSCGQKDGTTMRSLRKAGFDDAEIERFRTYIINAKWGETVSAGNDLTNGWKLLGTPEQVIVGMIGHSPTDGEET